MYSWKEQCGRNKIGRTEWESGELSGEFMEWNTVERAMNTETDTRTERSGQARLVCVFEINHNIPTTWRWVRGDSVLVAQSVLGMMPTGTYWKYQPLSTLTLWRIESYIVERTIRAELRPEEQNEKAESCRENLWNEIQLKGHKNRIKKEWASSVGLSLT